MEKEIAEDEEVNVQFLEYTRLDNEGNNVLRVGSRLGIVILGALSLK